MPSKTIPALFMALGLGLFCALPLRAGAGDALTLPKASLVSAPELVKILKGPVAKQPKLIHVGFSMLYAQAHIPGSVYTGGANTPEGLDKLAATLKGVPKGKEVLIYCGCCPWNKCPNVAAAYKKVLSLGFKKVKVLHIPSNFGADWAEKGYPVEGE